MPAQVTWLQYQTGLCKMQKGRPGKKGALFFNEWLFWVIIKHKSDTSVHQKFFFYIGSIVMYCYICSISKNSVWTTAFIHLILTLNGALLYPHLRVILLYSHIISDFQSSLNNLLTYFWIDSSYFLYELNVIWSIFITMNHIFLFTLQAISTTIIIFERPIPHG